MTFRRWFLPLGRYSPNSHTPGHNWYSLCGAWDLTRPGVIEDDISRPKCADCLGEVRWLDAVEAGASHAGGEDKGQQDPASPLATPAPYCPTEPSFIDGRVV